MKSTFLALLLCASAQLGFALDAPDVRVPMDQNNRSATSLDFVGATSSAPIPSTTGELIYKGKGVLLAVSASSSTALDSFSCHDSTGAVSDNAQTLRKRLFQPVLSTTSAPGTGGDTTVSSAFFKLPIPVEFTSGLSCTSSNARVVLTVYYRKGG